MWFRTRVYADAAAATPVSRRSSREFLRLISLYGNPGGLHKESVAARKELEGARRNVAASIGAHPDEIIFVGSGTEANNLAIQGVLRPLLKKNESAHAITSAIEHQSVLEPLRALQKEGLSVTEVGVDTEGLLFPNAITDAITPRTVFASIQLINSEIGSIQPVREIAKELRRVRSNREAKPHGERLPIYFHVDASQAPLWMELNVERLGIDLMTLDAQKMLGPKGVGVLFVRRGVPLESLMKGGKQENGMRAGTEHVAAAGALAVALAEAKKGVEKRSKKTATRRDYLWSEIKKQLPDALLNGADLLGGKRVANNLNLSIPGLDAEMAVISLDALGVAAATRSTCSAGEEEPSHVMKALGFSPELSGTAIRFTLLPGVTKRHCRRIAQALFETATRYRKR